jgi:hypothetical protein
VVGGLCYGLGFYTYITFRITPVLLLVVLLSNYKNVGFWKRGSIFLMVSLIVAMPLGWHYLRHPADFLGRTAQISVMNSGDPLELVAMNSLQTALMFIGRGDTNLRHNIPGAPELFWPVGCLFVLGIVLGGVILWNKTRLDHRFAMVFLYTWLIVGALPEILSDEGIPHSLRALLMVVPATVFAAIGASWVYDLLTGRFGWEWMTAIAACFLAFVAWAAYSQYFVVWAADPDLRDAFNEPAIEVAEEIDALPASA